jgi:cobalt-zinc-cadmium efflux system membrane fusion protein
MSAGRFQAVLRHLRRTAPADTTGASDDHLLERFRTAHDEAAFELLVWRHGGMVWSLCRRLLRDEEDAHDAFQAAFLTLARRAGSVGARGSVGGWLYQVAYRAALAARTRAARRTARERPLPESAPLARGPDPCTEAAWHELRQALDEEVSRLPERYRLPLVLCCFAGKTNAEAARELGCPVGTVESRLTRARQRLRTRLARRGFPLPAVLVAVALPRAYASACPPAALVTAAVRTAAPGAAGTLPAGVAALARHLLRTTLMTRLTAVSLLALALGTLAVWTALPVPGATAGKPGADAAALVPGQRHALKLPAAGAARLGLRVGVIPPPAPAPPRRLELIGVLTYDRDRLMRIRSRFPGEIIEIGKTAGKMVEGAKNFEIALRLRAGDRVAAGQLLAVIWSKELGEKKAALVDALAMLHLSQERLRRLEMAYKEGVAPQAALLQAQREAQKDLNAVTTAERTLGMWRLSAREIEDFRREAEQAAKKGAKRDPETEKRWARLEVRSPLAGTLLERNASVGDMVTPDTSLFVVTDRSQLQVEAEAPVAELPALRALKPKERRWEIRVRDDPEAGMVEGRFERISPMIDAKSQTVMLLGTVAKTTGRLLIGQAVKVTLFLPGDIRNVAIPAAALVDEGGKSFVFVQPDPGQEVYQQRRVLVVRRGQDIVHVRAAPTAEERRQGFAALRAGERVVTAGAVELQGLLADLEGSPGVTPPAAR